MIVSRTPLRISFSGGGTDIRSFYSLTYGSVISTTINKYLYVILKKQTGIAEYKYRVNWSKVEFCNNIKDIKHPIVRETLKYFKVYFPIEITTISDIPANSGLGSSSAFTVGLIKALSKLLKINISKYDIAALAAKIEVDILKRNIGKQDHYSVAYGNLNIFNFLPNEKVKIQKISIDTNKKKQLEKNLILFWTRIKRDASKVLKKQNKRQKSNYEYLIDLRNTVSKMKLILQSNSDLKNFGELLDYSWNIKKKLSNKISNKIINKYYNTALKNGAVGGKLLGAGGGGFLLIYVNNKNKKKLINSLSDLEYLEFKFENTGSKIIFNSYK